MFCYRPPKSSIWGHAILPRNTAIATQRLHAFLAAWFEPIVPDEGALESSFTCMLKWKTAVLPHVLWHPAFLQPGRESSQGSLCMVTLGNGSRISFGGGLLFPLSPTEEASYQFLEKFSADAPFKMSPKHFQVGITLGRNARLAWRKPDAPIAARLREVI